MIFTDILYGSVELPDWLIPFLKIPEFVRLRGVRLSNVDSYEFKDFSGPTRWEHCIGVAHLAIRFCGKKNITQTEQVQIILAALLHDVATPPFAHTIEYVIDGYDHELESNKILSASNTDNSNPGFPIFASQLPMFRDMCQKTSKLLKIQIDPDEIAEMVTGGGKWGFLINGTIDLDNIDNVSRASLFLGINVSKQVAYDVVDWLANFNTVPTDLENESNQSVLSWIGYKNKMYSKFFNSHEEELGRQAFLQHLIRRAYNEGMPRNSIIWNTDEGLLHSIEYFTEKYHNDNVKNIFNYATSLKELVQRYRLLECAHSVFRIPIDDINDFKAIKNPSFTNWLEDILTTTTFEPFVLINSRRFNNQNTLFSNAGGEIQVYKLSNENLKPGQLREWIREKLPKEYKMTNLIISNIIKEKVTSVLKDKPWLRLTSKRKESIKANLDNIGNWSFRLSRNEGLHSYPATFVHAIPSSLITALGLKGELVLDPFGGTGQTAFEAIKLGCNAITSDSNSIATMISKVKFTYYSKKDREKILSVNYQSIIKIKKFVIPNFEGINKWHHKETVEDLAKIKKFIDDEENQKFKLFYTLCFSDILTSCTARKGKEHGYFADNTPLSKGELAPPKENAISHFLNKIKRNIEILEKQYSYFEKNGRSVATELKNASVKQFDITKVESSDFGIEENSISGIITSPPYLCMADYTLGQRLSYYWLFPEKLKEDFKNEIGSRRSRTQKESALDEYIESMRLFARNSARLLKKNGFIATIIGEPLALAYKEKKILDKLDEIFLEEGLELFWSTYRPISWHRNHGYARLKEERIAVHIKK